MGSEWPLVRLGDVVDLTTGFPFASQQYTDDPTATRLLRGDNVGQGAIRWDGAKRWPAPAAEGLDAYWLREGDVILAMDRPWIEAGLKYAYVRQSDLPALLVQRVARLRGSDRLDTGFLRYVIAGRGFTDYVTGIQTGTAVPHISGGQIQGYRFPLPPLAEQKRIAGILGALDEKIELNRRMSQTLESLVREYVDRAVADRPMVPCRSALEVRMGAPFKGAAFSAPGTGRPLLRIRDLKTFVSGTWTTEIRGDETTIGPGDIVVGMDAEFRATLWLGEESVLNQRVCSFRGIDGVGRAFVLSALGPDLAFQEQAKTGTTVIHLNKADIDAFTVPELSVSEHRSLTATTEPLIELVVANSIQNHSLIAIRDALIARLLSNRIRVPQEVSG
jgi:type I restriction enzyme S subunit